MMLLSLTYVSSATRLLDGPTLAELLAAIRPKNRALGLTGMLLYCDGNIIQTLEGPEAAVEATFETIEADRRHRGIIVILREPIEDRAFPDWSMGFHQVGEPPAGPEGFSTFMDGPSAGEHDDGAGSAYRLLELFRDTVT